MRSLSQAFLLLVPLSVWAQSARVLTPEVDEFVEGVLSRWGSHGGVSIAVVRLDPKGEWNVETKGYGVARLEDNSSVTDETLFSIGSNSKVWPLIRPVLQRNLPCLFPYSFSPLLLPGY